ncbi:MAG: hypothetical protein K8R69_04530 [Deltaproteobacteria bacterium]|nr:hypothetical protein [Deltaproteobacteria bacterium]
MESQLNTKLLVNNTTPYPVNESHGRGPAVTKSLSSGGYQDPALVSWFEQANAYYNAVMAGDPNSPRPDAQAWNEFLSQLEWAKQQLGYGQPAWDPSMGGMGGATSGGTQQGQNNAFGGIPGTMDNWVYTSATSEIGFTGDGTHDIWSNDFTLDVSPVSAQVTIEYTMDTRLQPPEQVAKITVKDPATGTEAVYFVHDFDPAAGDTIKINTPDASQVTDTDGLATWGEFTQDAAGSKPEASIPGVEQPNGDLLYEPEFSGEVVDFFAQPGEDQTHIVYADANISVKPSDEVKFTTGLDGQPIVVVTHSDGSKDTYKIQKGYNVNVNVNEEYIQGEIPSIIQDRVTINGAAESTGTMNGDAIVEALLSATGRNEAQLQSALDASGLDMTVEEFKAALAEGQITDPISSKVLDFLGRLDPKLSELINESLTAPGEELVGIYEGIRDRLVELVGILDPNSIVTPGAGAGEKIGANLPPTINHLLFNARCQASRLGRLAFLFNLVSENAVGMKK